VSVAAAGCGCCSGVGERTPLAVQNRPGLSAIAYRVGVHSDFLASLVAGLTDADRPRLAGLGTRDPDDFTIALLDSWAVAADVLSFYGERLAQESYLRTARERISLQELGRLIGYRLRPGAAAETQLAFALEPPPAVPAATTRDPGSAPPVTPAVVTLEPGLRVQSIPGPGEQPQTFETVEAIEARPEWNAIPASPTAAFTPGPGDTHAYLEGAALDLEPGDAILLAGPDPLDDHWDLRMLTRVVPDADAGRTEVVWDGALGPQTEPELQPYAFRKRVAVFGHNAPDWNAMTEEFQKAYSDLEDVSGLTNWPQFEVTDQDHVGDPVVDLDGSHPDVVPGSFVVLVQGGGRELWRVDSTTDLSRAAYAVSGKITRLQLEGAADFAFAFVPRTTIVHAVSEPLELVEAPDESAVAGGAIDVDVDVSEMTHGRRLLVRGVTAAGEEHVEAAVVDEVQAVAGGWRLVLQNDLAFAYERASVVVHGNVASASHGETVQQLLGSGRAGAAFQRFTLAHEPLTYVQTSADPAGAGTKAALEVRVNDARWDEVPTLYGAGSRDRAYAVRVDEEGKTYVQFGDGVRGSRLPTGSNNVRAEYRKGLGAAGNVKAGALAQLLDRPLGLKGVGNPAPAEGGVDPETEEDARESMPLGVRTLGRTVSLLDYEDYARAFTGVVKARAAVLPLRGGRTIVVTVAFEGGDRLDDLQTALRTYGDPHVEVLVLAGTTATFRLALKVAVDPAYETEPTLSAVEAALRAAYAFERRGFGEPVFASEVVATVHTVTGVVAADLDRLYAGAFPGLGDRLLAQQPAVGPGGTAVPAGVLVLALAPLDWLVALE
jgi:uncharacterized phage protein gp47/JayE